MPTNLHLANKQISKNFTGIDSPYEPPLDPDIVVNTVEMTAEEAADFIIQKILPLK